ncbi:Ig-like domain-containing protein [Bradyrhizobium sp. WYCCWR 13022]|uniref:Ig-like domain-containing protein n=1 Tax=unclassified Bradyrhizobium TaxID=2631580 RepID=UPI00263B7FC7|nr:Ig-like domain-containing protein [Bradyrhizobium sp. WYCCWR 13022]MDN4983836.1 Ig-like domain-containing protein [Bradyrhizobium sp. WYCCWR 13022]
MKYTDTLPSIGSDHQSLHFGPVSAADHRPTSSVEIPDAHLLFSGNFERIGADLILSDELHRVIVPNYFRDHVRPLLVSPEGAPLDPGVVDTLTGHTQYAQAGAPAAGGKVVGHVVKMTGSASIVRNGVAIVANVGDAVYQSDVVQTGSGSTLGLVLDDGTTFNLSASSRFLLNELTYDASSTSNSSLMTLVQGAASFVAGQVAKTGDMRVATPTATIGIRGTAVILDVSATDGKVSVSVVDQQDGQVHAVQVFNTAGVLIGTVTSNGSTLTLTPTANFDVIAQQTNKTTDQVAQEFSAFQQVLSTYDSGKQLFPNLPQHTENKDQNNNNPSPNSTTKFAGSPPLQPPGTEYHPPAGTTTVQPSSATTSTVVVTVNPSDAGTDLATTKSVTVDPIIIPVKLSSIPFVVTPPSVAAITSGAGDHIGPVMSANGDVVYDPDGAIYFFSRETGTTTTIASPSSGWSYGSPTISSDGRYIVYQGSDGSGSFVFVYGTDSSDPAHYHVQTELAPGSAPTVSGDGSAIVVEQGGGNIAIYDLQGNLKAVITPAAAGSSGALWKPAISADGHIVVFWNSDAAVSGGAGQLDVLDLSTGGITQIGNTAIGAGTAPPTVSADGHLIAYQSTDGTGHSEIYLYDLNAGTVVFHTSNASGSSYSPVLSPDGHFIVFTSDAQLASADHNSFADIYIVDVTNPAAPVYKLVSDGVNAASNGGAAISAGGQYVAFGNSSNIFFADPTSGLSAIILETVKSPAMLTAKGAISITGDYTGVDIGVTDQFGSSTPNFTASFDSAGHINWTFSELKSDFAFLSYGQDATQEFIVTLSADNGTLTIPVFITVHDGVQPTIQTADAAPVAAPVTLAQGQQDNSYTITPAALLTGVADIDGPSLTITSLAVRSGGGGLVQNSDLTWTYTPDPGFSGQVVFDYTVSDSIKSAASIASLNIALPLAITSIAPDGGVVGDFVTNGTSLTVSGTNGTLSAGEKIQISSDGGITWSDAVQTSGSTWSLTDPVVHISNFAYQARVVDSANNAVNSVVQAITIDTAAPVVGITSGSGLTNHANQIVAGTVDLADAGTTVIVFDNGNSVAGAVVGADGHWSTVVSLTEGDNSLVAQDSDVAGNVGVSNTIVISLDTTAPSAVATVTALSPDSGSSSTDFNTNVASQTISGTYTGALGSGEVIQVSADGGATWVAATASSGNWSASGVTLSPGAGLLSVRTIDLAGNTTSGTGHAYTLDQNAPTAVATVTALSSDTGSSSSDFVTSSSSQTVSGSFTGTLSFGEQIQVSADGGATWVTASTSGASWSASGVTLSTGTGALSVRTIDLAGNITSGAGHSYTLDQTAPSGGAPDLIATSDSGVSSTDNITNVLAPTFSVSLGSGVAVGDIVELRLNGASFSHPLVHAVSLADLSAQSISFSVNPGDLGIDGAKQISALFTDAAGNSTTSSVLGVTLDTSAPVVTIGNAGGNTNQVAQTISGTVDLADAGATVSVLDGGAPVATATVQADGSWSTSVTLQSGNNDLTAQVTDTAGNQGVSNVVTYTLNTNAPIGGTPDLIAASDSGSSSTDNITNVTAPIFTVALGTNVVVGDTVELLLGGSSLATPVLHTVTSADVTAHSVSLTVTAGDLGGDGNKQISAQLSDSFGNSSTTAALIVTVDTTVPSAVATVTALGADSGSSSIDFVTNVASQTVSGTYTGSLGSGETIQVSADGGTTWVTAIANTSNNTWSAAGVTLSAAGITLSVRTIDPAGNVTAGTSHSYTLDTTAPSAVATVTALSSDSGSSSSDFVTNVASQTVSGTYIGTLGSGETIRVSADGGATWVTAAANTSNHTWSASGVALSPSGTTLSVQTIDTAGNATAGTGHSYTLDTSAPTAVATVTALNSDSGSSSSDFITGVASQTVSGTYSGTLGSGETIQVSADGGTAWVTATENISTNTWSAPGVTLLAAGTTLSVRTIDLAGNVAAGTSHSYTLDTTAPTAVATVTTLSSDSGSSSSDFVTSVASQTVSGTYSGTLGSGETVQISADGGATWVTATANTSNNTWSAAGVTLLAAGTTLSVRTIDLAGNSTAGTGHSYTLDTTAPAAVATVTALSSDTGSSSSDFVTNVASQTVSGTYSGTLGSGETIRVSADGGTTWVTATVNTSNHTWSASAVTLSPSGTTLSVQTIDTAGNATTGTPHSYTLDTTAPTAVATVTALSSDSGSLSSDFITNVASQTVSGTYIGTLGAGETIQVSADGGTTWVTATVNTSNHTWSASGVTLSPSGTTLSVQTIDAAGNATAGVGHSYTLDSTAPTAVATVTALSSDTGSSNSDFITDVASQTVSGTYTGTLGSGETIQVSADGGATWVAAIANTSNHTWSASGVTLSASGTTLSVQTIDTAGNVTAGTGHSYTLDTTAPTAVATVTALSSDSGSSSSDFITSAASQTVSGTYSGTFGTGETIQVSADGGTTWVAATVNTSNHTWSASGVTLSPSGTTLSVQTIDTAGNATAGTGHSYTLDTSAPTAVATVTALSSDTGTSNSDFVTSVASQTVSGTYTGTLGSGETIRVSADGGTNWVTATANASNHTWSASGVTLLASGTSLSVQTIDPAGNVTSGTPHSYTLDTTAPTAAATVTALSSDSGNSSSDFITNVALQTVSGTYTGTLGTGETIQVSADGGTTWVTAIANTSNHTWSASGVTLSASGTTLSVQTIDTAGNATAGTGHSYTLDTTAPTAVAAVTALSSDSGSSSSDFITSVASQTVSGTYTGTLGSGEAIQVSADGGTTWVTATVNTSNHTWSLSGVTLSPGGTTLSVQTIDAAGNITAGTGHSYSLDTSAPTAVATVTALSADTGTSNSDFVTSVASQTVSGAYTGTLGSGETIQVSADGGTTWVTATANTSANTWSAAGVTLLAGGTTLSVRTIDLAGNITAGTGHSYTLDSSAPPEAVAITSITGASSPASTSIIVAGTNGALRPGDKVQISSSDNATWTDVVASGLNRWSFADNVARSSSFTYFIRVVDSAGNAGATATQSVVVANNGATVAMAAAGGVAEFTGTGGNLQVGAAGVSATINAISVASGGSATINGSGNVITSAGDAIDLYATGAPQGSPENLLVNPTGTITGAASGISVAQNAAGSIMVTTSGPVTGLAGRGILAQQTATGTGAITINGSGTVIGTGAAFSGIAAQNLNSSNNADITVSQTGNIIGGHDGIHVQTNGNGNISVTTAPNPLEATAQIVGSALYGIEAQSKGTGNILITTAAGTVITSGGVGINAYNEATSLPKVGNVIASSISVNASGVINSGVALTGQGGRAAGILAGYKGGTTNTVNASVYGNVVVNNSATINAAGGDGIRAYNFGPGNVSISNSGMITAKDVYGIVGSSNGTGNVSVTTTASSSITSGSHGILAINQATSILQTLGSTVTVIADGTINSGVHLSAGGASPAGISAGYYGSNGTSNPNINGSVLVDNAANITARAGYGIIAFNLGYGNIAVINRADTSVSGGQFGINVGSSVNGTASPSDVSVTIEANSTPTIAAVTASSLMGLAAINANNSSGGNITIVTGANDQFISGGFGINANSSAGSVAVGKQISVTTSTGLIDSGYNVFSGGGTPAAISAGYGVLSPASIHGNVVLDNSATVTAASGSGINLYNNGNGSISATLRPTSSINAAQGAGVTAFSAAGGNIGIDNQGAITAAAIGISVNNGSSASVNGLISISNSGTVYAPGVPYMPVVTIGNANSTQTATVSNSATKSIASTLFARTTGNVAISFFTGNGSVTNNGTITGNVNFSGSASGSFSNASGATWNINGWNSFGSGTSTIGNSGLISLSGLAALSGPSAITLTNTGSISVSSNASAQIFANVSGAGAIALGDHAALELGSFVAASQAINLAGRDLLTFDNPASVGTNLPLTFSTSGNGNIGTVITLQGSGITAANVSGSTLTVSGAQNQTFQVSGTGLSGNTFDVLSSNRIVLVPSSAQTVSGIFTSQPAVAPANFYILDNYHINSSTGAGFNLSTSDTANTYTIVANASSDIVINGAFPGLRVATQGASGAIINAANIAGPIAGTGPITGVVVDTTQNANTGNGSADIVNYANVSGTTNGITANTVNGNISIVNMATTVAGTSSYGILGVSSGTGNVTITSSGGTITGGFNGIRAAALQEFTPGTGNVIIYNSSSITSGANSNNAGSGAAGLRARILNNNNTVPNAAIAGDVTIENRASITALAGAGIFADNYGSGNTSVTFAGGQNTITAVNGGATGVGSGLTQYGIFAFTYGIGSSLVNSGYGTTITSGSTGINAGNQATTIASGSGSTVSVYSQGFISSGTNVNNGGSAQSAIQAGYNPGGSGAFSSAVYGDVIVNVASDGNPFGNPNPTLLAAAGPGILAYDYGVGNITVSVGSGVSINALNAASSSSGGNAPYGISATNRGPGSISVLTLNGSSINSGSTGINAVNDANPTVSTPDLVNLFAANAATGNPAVVAVTAAGTITAGGQQTNSGGTPSGIAAGFFGGGGHSNQYVSGNVFINNAAVVNAAGFGLQGYNFGYGSITINVASGANITAGSNGIYAHADGGFTDPVTASALTRDISINVSANTTITAGSAAFNKAYGILAFSVNASSISIVTSAGDTIDSQQGGSGINAVNEATSIAQSFNSSVVVTNAATIHSGIGLTGFNGQPAGIIAGYIGQTTDPSLNNPPNPANYNVYGEVDVNNFGNITSNAGDGIRAYNYGVGDVYVNNFAGTIVAMGGASPPNGTGVGILAQNFGPGSIHLTTSATTSITSGSSGIAAVNKATTADPLHPTVVVPATSEIAVYASGIIKSGTTLTGSGDVPAGILAGYNPNNLNNPQVGVGVHGNVFVDSHATIQAPFGTDGIRGVNYGGPDSSGAGGDINIFIETDSTVTGGRYGVAALSYGVAVDPLSPDPQNPNYVPNGGDVSVTNNGAVFGGGLAAINATTNGAGVATIDNTGFVSGVVIGYNATFTNEASGRWLFDGTSSFTGASSFTNAGTIETSGTSAISGLDSFTNTGMITVDLGTLTIGAPMTGGGTARLYNGTLVLTGVSDVNVQFADINPVSGGELVLLDPIHFTGTVTGFDFADAIDLANVAPGSVSVTNDGGFLRVNFAGGAIQLLGNYAANGFSINSDLSGGTLVRWEGTTHGPVIDASHFTLQNNADGTTTIFGLNVSDTDPVGSLNMAMATITSSGVGTVSPSSGSGTLSDLTTTLNNGVIYNPTAAPAQKEMITMTITDSDGGSDAVHFIFTPGSNNGGNGVTLQGTSGEDVIFATGGPDTLTGGAGADLFVITPNGSSTAQDTITDFVEGFDKIDLRQMPGIFFLADIQSRATQQGNDALIDFGATGGVILKNVLATSLLAGDFIFNNGVTGTTGNDTLVGTGQVDGLFGLDGNDRLQGLAGNDWLDGGQGFDRAIYTDATGPVTINLAAGTVSGAGVGTDTLVNIEGAVGSNFADTYNSAGFTGDSAIPGTPVGFNEFEGKGGDDTIISNLNSQGAELTRVSYVSATGAVTVDLMAGYAQGDASVGHDTLVGSGFSGVYGSAFDDTISGSNNPNFTAEVFAGFAGNDLIDGRGGFDRADYNVDSTTTSGINVNLAAGIVTGDATVGTDTLRSVEAVRGTNFADTYDATGFSNNSTNAGSLGTFNEFTGNGGDDTIIGNGNTRLGFNNATAGVNVDFVTGIATGDASVGTDHFSGVNAVQASVFDDTLLGGATNDTFTGLAGNDYIDGRGGFDISSYNNIFFTTGGVTVNMAAGIAAGDASIGSDTLHSIEGIQGTMFADTYDATGFGQAGAANVGSLGTFNQFEGLGGDDTITGNGNTKVIYGNSTDGVTITIGVGGAGTAQGTASGDLATVGHDVFTGGVNAALGSNFADVYDAHAFDGGFNAFQGNAGDDTITGNGATQIQYGNATTSGVTITIGAGGVGTAAGDTSVGTDHFTGVNSAIGSSFADSYNASGFSGFNSFQGQGGNDTITGNGATQIQFSNATAGVAVDLAAGTADGDGSVGHDIFTGVSNVVGSNFNDTITGNAANNVLSGLNGNDTFVFKEVTGGGIGNDVITDFVAGQDHIQLDYAAFDPNNASTFSAWLSSHASTVNGTDTLIDLDPVSNPGKDTILLKTVAQASLHASDFIVP